MDSFLGLLSGLLLGLHDRVSNCPSDQVLGDAKPRRESHLGAVLRLSVGRASGAGARGRLVHRGLRRRLGCAGLGAGGSVRLLVAVGRLLRGAFRGRLLCLWHTSGIPACEPK